MRWRRRRRCRATTGRGWRRRFCKAAWGVLPTELRM